MDRRYNHAPCDEDREEHGRVPPPASREVQTVLGRTADWLLEEKTKLMHNISLHIAAMVLFRHISLACQVAPKDVWMVLNMFPSFHWHCAHWHEVCD